MKKISVSGNSGKVPATAVFLLIAISWLGLFVWGIWGIVQGMSRAASEEDCRHACFLIALSHYGPPYLYKKAVFQVVHVALLCIGSSVFRLFHRVDSGLRLYV